MLPGYAQNGAPLHCNQWTINGQIGQNVIEYQSSLPRYVSLIQATATLVTRC